MRGAQADQNYAAGRTDLLMEAVIYLFRQRPDGAREFAAFANAYTQALRKNGEVTSDPHFLSTGETVSWMQQSIEDARQFEGYISVQS